MREKEDAVLQRRPPRGFERAAVEGEIIAQNAWRSELPCGAS
jgi:hypothetical protein